MRYDDTIIPKRSPEKEAREFNKLFPKGTRVRYWTLKREGRGKVSRTRSEAQVLSGHTAVVWVEGEGYCVALSHIEPLPEGASAVWERLQGRSNA